ncbi:MULTISPECIES: exodeoxyribonuclease VII large subunit [unclassified Nitratiruptor]|uniref:exodeoxyribonuclease VII large subunit n=1 Tax=unclassified Nitratiruptor TaxID=2624044 RepID=UPI0019163A49|nr:MULTISPECIES: exodeoxyribonuclease VII large subunit [unclassified Nitratiruptor]BCD59766.1 exodeoxyribonuclease VII large subunit [Nitratiruptor sp. YY08-10]BCD63690.1 exodeoxyribonuclease VII large subunit [Nitratiruptor sp. YY08-14]
MNVYTVSQLNEQIKNLLESHFVEVYVEGEVSRPTYHTSGHLYFSLKDEKSVIRCVMFRSALAKVPFRVEDGQKLIVAGKIGVYKPRGEYQLYATELHPSGVGSLQLAFEQLKAKLEKKGYFASELKKPLPDFIQTIALVTSQTGAALQDMLRIIQNRWPLVKVYVVDTLVQGSDAAPMIARSIAYADGLGVDVIVVGRGGGSLEDLWPFNEEIVADAIFEAKTPIVSAVGHEIDFLISDFVADLRAPTPSAAMEMILPDRQEMLMHLDLLMQRLTKRMQTILQLKTQELDHLQNSLFQLSPQKRLEFYEKEITIMKERMKETITVILKNSSHEIPHLKTLFDQKIEWIWKQKQQDLTSLQQKLTMAMEAKKIPKNSAQMVKNGKPVSLEDIDVGDEVELQDLHYKALAKILSKDAL